MNDIDIASWSGQEIIRYVNHELRQHAAVAFGYCDMLIREGTDHVAEDRDRDWLLRLHHELVSIQALVDFFDTWGRQQTAPVDPLDDAKIQGLHEHIAAYMNSHKSR